MTSSAFESCSDQVARAFDWSALLSLTYQMLDAARAGEWDRVRKLEPDRRRHIERFFAAGVAPDEAELVRDGILGILSSDQELLRLIRGLERRRPANVIQFRRRTAAAHT